MVGLVLLCSTMFSYAQAQRISVESEKAANTDFSKFKTFYWISQIDSESDKGSVFFLNDLVLQAQVIDAVKAELMGLGYTLDANKPDMLVNFRVFDSPTTLRIPEDYGNNYWGGYQLRPISDRTIDVKAGTLLINLIDRENGTIVWQGFASGLINNNAFIKDEATIHEAVNLIFENFNERAKDYSRK
jgi:hypothetical protein